MEAEIYAGLQRMVNELSEFHVALKEAFISPFASHSWLSCRSRSHWVELEGWQDSIAGPLFEIADKAGCEYVYHREDWYFVGIKDPAALTLRLLEWHEGLLAGVNGFSPKTSEEREDWTYMKSLTDQMEKLIEQGCRIEQLRFSAAQ